MKNIGSYDSFSWRGTIEVLLRKKGKRTYKGFFIKTNGQTCFVGYQLYYGNIVSSNLESLGSGTEVISFIQESTK